MFSFIVLCPPPVFQSQKHKMLSFFFGVSFAEVLGDKVRVFSSLLVSKPVICCPPVFCEEPVFQSQKHKMLSFFFWVSFAEVLGDKVRVFSSLLVSKTCHFLTPPHFFAKSRYSSPRSTKCCPSFSGFPLQRFWVTKFEFFLPYSSQNLSFPDPPPFFCEEPVRYSSPRSTKCCPSFFCVSFAEALGDKVRVFSSLLVSNKKPS